MLANLLSFLSQLQIRVYTWRHGELVGTDSDGNRYYRTRKTPKGRRERRWVLYSGEPEASRVPPEWHGWLHHSMKEPLKPGDTYHKPWQKDHKPNQTGTSGAYLPPGHTLAGGQRSRATGDYESWTPN